MKNDLDASSITQQIISKLRKEVEMQGEVIQAVQETLQQKETVLQKSQADDQIRAEKALRYIQELYAVEQMARELSSKDRKDLRLEKALPILNQMAEWMAHQISQVLPQSTIRKAMNYSANRWQSLTAYLYDGTLEIDNNLVENAIRPLALGRKNYLFSGSHDAAQRAAIIYTFFANCKKHDVNPRNWLKYTLENIMDTSIQELEKLYPQSFTVSEK